MFLFFIFRIPARLEKLEGKGGLQVGFEIYSIPLPQAPLSSCSMD